MSTEATNGQPKQVRVNVTSEQMAALVLLQRRIADLNLDVQALGGLGCRPLAFGVEQATVVMSKAHDDFIVELQKAVKIPTPDEVAGLTLVKS